MVDDESGLGPDPRIGSLVDDRYKISEAMAAGSMGIVYKAERVPVGKLVAIKFLHAPFANDSEFLGRFERETRVMSKLAHPNCVSVVDFGVWDGAPYLVMEYVSGTTLRALIDDGALPPPRALALIRQIAAGLAHAHAQGVVHRDIKPANIMVSEEIGTGDHVRILDFGLARLRGAPGRDATQSNVVVGTPNYMAPEQTVGGGMIDARTDIYAVGIVLFEMVSGERPFQADDTLALLGMHRAAPIPRLAECMPPDAPLPPGLQEVVDRAMAKSPSDRFQSAIELAEAIDQVASQMSGRPATDAGEPAIRRSGARRADAMAPTVLDLSDAAELVVPARGQRRGGRLGLLLLLVLLAGGVGTAGWWIRGHRAASQTAATPAGSADPPVHPRVDVPAAASAPAGAGSSGSAGSTGHGSAVVAADPAGSASPVAAAGAGSAGTAAAPAAAGSAPAAARPGSGSGVTEGQGSSAGAEIPPPTGSAAAGGSGPAPTEVAAGPGADTEMDPTTADDPAPASARPSGDEDEDANAPRTADEVEKHAREVEKRAPTGPVPAITLQGAVQLIQDGKHELAMTNLLALWKKTPASAYIPFLLGNLYYDQRWWTVAMDHYALAIKKNAQYRSNPTLNRNVIRMLASDKTSRKAQGFLRFIVGRPSLPYLRAAAQRDPSNQVRKTASWLLRAI